MKDFDNNPELQEYVDIDGKKLRLDEFITLETAALSSEYIERYGVRPHPKMTLNWMMRLKRAYHKCEILKMETRQ